MDTGVNFNTEESAFSHEVKSTNSEGATSFNSEDVENPSASKSCNTAGENSVLKASKAIAASGVQNPSFQLRVKERKHGSDGMEVSTDTAASRNGSTGGGNVSNSDNYRIQVHLGNGNFTNALKDALLRDLNTCLFSLPANLFVPSLSGSGLRFGAVWFAPDNAESCSWLKQKLSSINEKAGDFTFKIEPFSLYQTRIAISIPWDPRENLKYVDILRRFRYQYPLIRFEYWRIVKTKTIADGFQLIVCCIDDYSLKILKSNNFRMNYAFDKVFAKILQQHETAKQKP